MKSASAFCIAWLAFAPLVAAQTNRDAADAAFRSGLDALDDKKWQEAATHLRRAVQLNPSEDVRRVTRGFLDRKRDEYLPFYFLGQALFNLQECSGAVEAWSTSESQGAVKARPEALTFMAQGYTACEAKGVLPPVKYLPLLARTRQQLTDVSGQAAAISERGKSHLEIWRADASLQALYERAMGEYQAAQVRLNAATRTRAERDFADAAAAAERSRGVLNTLKSLLDNRIAAITTAGELVKQTEQSLNEARSLDSEIDAKKAFMNPSLAAARQSAQEALGRARSILNAGRENPNTQALNEGSAAAEDGKTRLKNVLGEIANIEKRMFEVRLAEALGKATETFSLTQSALTLLDSRFLEKPSEATEEKKAQREALQKQFTALERRRDGAILRRNILAIEQSAQLAEDVRTQLGTLISTFGPVTIIDKGVRPELAEGARLFFTGEYEQALTVLDLAKLAEVPLQLHVHLFRAASLYALYVRSGEKDPARREQVVAEIEKCKQLNPAFQPDAKAFAPRFINFFASPSS